jgi:hypothetical protein
MRVRLYQSLVVRSLAGLACLVPGGCAERLGSATPATPAESLALMQTGRPVLNCREACLAEWQRAQPQAAQLEAGGRAEELALLVLRIGYQDDLSLYYLGRAAEDMGYRAAAASYYRQSMQLSGTSISCGYLSRQCGGLALPQTASLRLAAVERTVNPPQLRRAGPGPQSPKNFPGKPETPAPGPISSPVSSPGPSPDFSPVTSPGPSPDFSPVTSPVPSPSPDFSPVRSPGSSPGGPGASEFIEPPPAAH